MRPWRGHLSVSMVARILGEDPQTIRRWLRNGQLHGTHEGYGSSWEIPQREVGRILELRRRKLLEGQALLDSTGSQDRSE